MKFYILFINQFSSKIIYLRILWIARQNYNKPHKITITNYKMNQNSKMVNRIILLLTTSTDLSLTKPHKIQTPKMKILRHPLLSLTKSNNKNVSRFKLSKRNSNFRLKISSQIFWLLLRKTVN
jgi:hypothetical protein